MLSKESLIFVSGHNGLVGSSVLRRLKFHGYRNIIYRTRKQLDLKNQSKVFNFFKTNQIDAVINAAGKVGGIYANNNYRANFIYDIITNKNNIIHACYENRIKRTIEGERIYLKAEDELVAINKLKDAPRHETVKAFIEMNRMLERGLEA